MTMNRFADMIAVRLGLWALLAGLLLLCGAAWTEETARPRRVISLSPNITESIFAIGAGDLLVGVSEFSNYPPAALKIKRCGGWSNPNYEVITSLKPDLILVLGSHQAMREFGKARGIEVRGVTMDSVAGIESGLLELGRLLGHEDGATSLTRSIHAELTTLRTDLDRRPIETRPKVFVTIGRTPGALAGMHTASGGSFLDEAITLAGGRNVFHDVKTFYPQASKESLVARRPDVILELTGGGAVTPQQRQALINDWQGLPSIPAVREGRIEVLGDEFLLIPGPRLPEIVKKFRSVLYPSR